MQLNWPRRKLAPLAGWRLGAGLCRWLQGRSHAGHRGHGGDVNTTHHQSPEAQGIDAQPQDTGWPCRGGVQTKGLASWQRNSKEADVVR